MDYGYFVEVDPLPLACANDAEERPFPLPW